MGRGKEVEWTSRLLQILLPDLFQTVRVIFPIGYPLSKYDVLNGKTAKSECGIKWKCPGNSGMLGRCSEVPNGVSQMSLLTPVLASLYLFLNVFSASPLMPPIIFSIFFTLFSLSHPSQEKKWL